SRGAAPEPLLRAGPARPSRTTVRADDPRPGCPTTAVEMPTRYFSDLTDEQWDRVRAGVFGGHPDPEPLRRAIDGLRFRAAAWCPWALTPAELPPVSELR